MRQCRLKSQGICPGICHAANSAATLTQPRTHMDMVRTGLATYGLYPFKETAGRKLHLTPALSLKTRIIHLKQIPKGFRLGYGSTRQAERKSIIATVAVGYADGLSRCLSSRGEMLVNGLRVPIAGRICMDMTMLDVTDVPDPCVEDEVVIIGRQDHAAIHTDWIAEMTGTINYEVVSTIGRRVDRIYPDKRAAFKAHATTFHDSTQVSPMLEAVG